MTTLPLFVFERRSATPLYRQIYRGIRGAILEGRLRAGQRLPSTRALARDLGISRLPVLTAFEQLLHEGYIVGRVGAGTYVTASIPEGSGTRPRAREASADAVPDRPQRTRADSPDPDSLLGAFRVSLPALDRFPSKTWARLVSRRARSMTAADMAYSDPAGYPPLRQAIAEYLRTTRAVQCEPDQVLIVAGSQMALRLCAMALVEPGDDVCIEEPGYPGARRAFDTTGVSVRAVPVDDNGLIVRTVANRRRTPRLVHVTPSHQYPLGVSMSASRRLELLEWARLNDAWIVEDDYDSEYRFASRPLGALQGMDAASRVVYVGTFSKVLFPSLRIGYLVAPRVLLRAFVEHRESLDIFSPTVYQLALTDFFEEGHFARHVRRMRGIYLERRDALVSALERTLHGVLSVVNADAGMHLTAWLDPGIDDRELARRAALRGVSVTALSTCYSGRTPRSGLVLGFGGADAGAIGSGVETLASVIGGISRARD